MKALSGLALLFALCCALPASAADITDYFRLYHDQHIAPSKVARVLDILDETPDKILTASPSREVTIDRASGYLQVADSTGTDQVLTVALYRKADGAELLAVGGSNCADACNFSIDFFAISGNRLQPVAKDAVVPTVERGRFIKPGRTGPGNEPDINYVPARVGTSLTLKPWYGYEVEVQMSKTTRAAIQDVVLEWDRASARFR